MKKLFTLILGLGMVAAANAQMTEGAQARVYAYDLQQEETTAVVDNETVKAYTFTFKTNTPANADAKVILFAEGQNDVVVTATPTDITNKSWTATVTGATAGLMTADYNWKVEVSAPAVESFTELAGTPTYSDKKSAFRFFRSFALSVNQSPESDYFGNVYALHQWVKPASVASYRETGMYVYSPDLTLQNNGNPYKNDFYGTGEGTTKALSGLSPADMSISEDGRLFMTSINADTYNVYVVNPDDLTNVTKVFNSAMVKADDNGITALFASDGTRITSLGGGLTVYGTGENTTLMTLETKDIYPKIWRTPINAFVIGKDNTWDAAPSFAIASSAAMKIYTDKEAGATKNIHFGNGNIYHTLEATDNGFWGVQYYSSDNQSIPTLFYYSRITNMVEYSSYNDETKYQCNANSTALAVNDNLGLVAYTTTGSSSGTPAVIAKYTENEETGAVSIEEMNGTDYLMTILGSKADAMAFDYAGNLYAITSGNETMAVYALPDALVGENRRTTPAKSSLVATFDKNDLATSVEKVGVDANAPVEYFNLQGVKVENPANGIFIKKQGSKTTKVVL